ncbi:MAG: polyprenyl synthetase family protein, partial [Planctomycetota bacterium]|nr:polyprenyl synthetase family protein [Planctomycetota bacterium]
MATDLSPGSNLESALETKRKLLEDYLDRHLPSEDREPRTLHQAMRYSVLSGGKRIRPLLTLLVAEAVGGKVEESLPVAAAFECIHAYSLIHDDLPCMDDDDLRRGRATNHKVYGEAMAVLAGDALLTFAFELVAKGVADPRRASAVLLDMAHFAGAAGMVGGQAIDIESDGAEPDPNQLERIHRLKTQALITAAARGGALVVGSDDETLRCVTSYGEKVGLAFQIMDDL